jgi:nucleotide-binding universal stress UspA family protein
MIKDILVNLSVDDTADVASDYAMSAAELFGAHLSGMAFAFYPVLPVTTPMDALGVDVMGVEIARNRQAAEAAVQRFERALRMGGLRGDAQLLEGGVAESARKFGERARCTDLSIVAQGEPADADRSIMIEGALFGSGRPVIVVPFIHKQGINLDHVAACWDGSVAAARAIGDAMPLLERAKQIDVVTVTKAGGDEKEIPGADMAQHLARHGCNVDTQRVLATEIDTTSAILSYVADRGTSLLVMGGYGHSRLREYALGGVTRGILGSMTVPVLMSH